jgi:pyruvate phosphate dikinase-like enzyme
VTAAVVDLAVCAERPIELVGGKALGLGRLLARSLEVPDGFVLTTEAYRSFIAAHGVGERIARLLAGAAGVAGERDAALAIDAPEGDAAMAIVVQAMVPARAAGVMFTIDPVTGDPSQITIESTVGLGLPLEGGEITPDRYCVDKVTLGLRSREIATKPFADRAPEAQGSVLRVPLRGEEATASSLTAHARRDPIEHRTRGRAARARGGRCPPGPTSPQRLRSRLKQVKVARAVGAVAQGSFDIDGRTEAALELPAETRKPDHLLVTSQRQTEGDGA